MDGGYIALKGFKFQFDRSIIEIFKNPTKKVEIEQLQDYGIDDYYVQVKHHDTLYTPSQQKQKIKGPLLQLMAQHKQASSSNFTLYIYLKGVLPSERKLSLFELESYLGNKSTHFTKPEKLAFVKHFTLIHASNFSQQHKSVISEIRKAYSISASQAELFYSIISSHLLEVVTKHPPEKRSLRVSSKKVIDKLISDGKRLVFKSVFIDELSKKQQFNLLNKQFFKGPLNKEPHERIFVIDTDSSNSLTALKEIVLVLKSKWSKNLSDAGIVLV